MSLSLLWMVAKMGWTSIGGYLGEVPPCLKAGGWLLLEMGQGQGARSPNDRSQRDFCKA